MRLLFWRGRPAPTPPPRRHRPDDRPTWATQPTDVFPTDHPGRPGNLTRAQQWRAHGDRRRDHLPTRPTWRCQACGIAWPCSAAKLRLLAEYRHDRVALMVYLAMLQAEAADHLAELHQGTPPTDLTERFVAWARPRG